MKSTSIPRGVTVVLLLLLLGFVLPLSDVLHPVLIGVTRSLLLFAIVAFLVGGVLEKSAFIRLANVLVSITLFAVFILRIALMKTWDVYSILGPVLAIVVAVFMFYTCVRFWAGMPPRTRF